MGSITAADTGIISTRVPKAAQQQAVLAIVRRALERHGWVITNENAETISATIDGNKTDGSITIRLTASLLVYDWDGILTVQSNAQTTSRPVRLPRRWLRTLKVDIDDGLAAMPK